MTRPWGIDIIHLTQTFSCHHLPWVLNLRDSRLEDNARKRLFKNCRHQITQIHSLTVQIRQSIWHTGISALATIQNVSCKNKQYPSIKQILTRHFKHNLMSAIQANDLLTIIVISDIIVHCSFQILEDIEYFAKHCNFIVHGEYLCSTLYFSFRNLLPETNGWSKSSLFISRVIPLGKSYVIFWFKVYSFYKINHKVCKDLRKVH